MANVFSLLTGVGIGAAAMYVLDPEAGTKRRTLARDKMTEARNKMGSIASATAQDLDNRATGIVSGVRSRFSHEKVDDEVLEARVRSKVGLLVRHPRAITTEVSSGRVVLRGSVLPDEVQQLIDGVRQVQGVNSVENDLAIDETGQASRLNGEKPKPSGELDIMRHRWSPATRFLVSTAGAVSLGLIAYSFSDDSRRARGSSGWRKKPQSDQETSVGWGI